MRSLSSRTVQAAVDGLEALLNARSRINAAMTLSMVDYAALKTFIEKPFIVEDAVTVLGERKAALTSIEECLTDLRFKQQVIDYLEGKIDDGDQPELPEGTLWNPNH